MPAPIPIRPRTLKPAAVQIADPRLPRLREHVADLARRLEKVPDGPSEETVHRLRTGTRRAGALLQSLLLGRRASHATRQLQHEAAKLLREWKKLRQAAGEVRDLDVHRGLLAKLRKSWTAEDAQAAKDTQLTEITDPAHAVMLGQLDNLDTWLRHQRDDRADSLRKEVARRAPRCAKLAPVVLAALEKSRPASVKYSRGHLPAVLALEDFFRTSYAMPTLDRKNLHDFRKRTKEARYVAEAGGAEPHATAVANALKRIQDAIGSWHDVDVLHQEAVHALGDSGAELQALLAHKAAQQLQQALQISERMRHRLLGERLALKSDRQKRKPPAPADASHHHLRNAVQ
jgi:CHAD domain-containing protein